MINTLVKRVHLLCKQGRGNLEAFYNGLTALELFEFVLAGLRDATNV